MTSSAAFAEAFFATALPLYLCALPAGARDELLRQSDWQVLSVELRGCRDKNDFLDRVGKALKFPEWFGHNWDALADCLADMSWWPSANYLILLEHAADFCAADAAQFNIALEIFRSAATGQSGGPTPLRVLVDIGCAAAA